MKYKFSWGWFVFVLVWIVIVLGFIGGGIDINHGIKIDDEQIYYNNIENIQNISGELYIGPNNIRDIYSTKLSRSEDKVYIQTYDITEKKIKNIFKTLLNKGVEIKIIMEDKKYRQYQNTFLQIQDFLTGYNNFALKSDKQMKTQYVHSKVTIIDTGFWIQTANFNHSSFFANREHFFFSYDVGVLDSLKNIFYKDRNGEKITTNDIHPNLVICNINCRIIIEKLLDMAESSIIIQTQYISDIDILSILGKKVDSIKEVKMLVGDNNASKDLLKYFGKKIVRIYNKNYNHTKMILIDGKILLLGSMNLSQNSLDNNREIGILLKDKKLINKFVNGFEIDRQNSIYK